MEHNITLQTNRRMVWMIRAIHGMITAFFLTCIGAVYFAGITNQTSEWVYLAMAALVVEGVVVTINGGNCPLGPLHSKFGDQKAFFELLLPSHLAKKAVPVLGMVSLIGFLLVLF